MDLAFELLNPDMSDLLQPDHMLPQINDFLPTTDHAVSAGPAVGKRIEVLTDADWDGEYVWMEAEVLAYDDTSQMHSVSYMVDGLVKDENLVGTKSETEWRFSDGVSHSYATSTSKVKAPTRSGRKVPKKVKPRSRWPGVQGPCRVCKQRVCRRGPRCLSQPVPVPSRPTVAPQSCE